MKNKRGKNPFLVLRSRDNSVGEFTWLRDRRSGNCLSIPGRDKIFFPSRKHLYQVWGSPALLSERYWGYLPGRESSLCVKPTIYLNLVRRLKMATCLNSKVLEYAQAQV